MIMKIILQQSDDNGNGFTAEWWQWKWFYNGVMIMKSILHQSDDNENDFTTEWW